MPCARTKAEEEEEGEEKIGRCTVQHCTVTVQQPQDKVFTRKTPPPPSRQSRGSEVRYRSPSLAVTGNEMRKRGPEERGWGKGSQINHRANRTDRCAISSNTGTIYSTSTQAKHSLQRGGGEYLYII